MVESSIIGVASDRAVQAAALRPDTGAAPASMSPAAARDAARQLEGVFLSQMLGHMVEGLATEGPFGGGAAERIYRSMLVNEYGRAMAGTGSLGIADHVMACILRAQGEGETHGGA